MKNFNTDLLTFSIEFSDMMLGKVNNLEPFSKKYRHLLSPKNLDEKSCRKLLKLLAKRSNKLNKTSRDLMEITYNALIQIYDKDYKFKIDAYKFRQNYDNFLKGDRELTLRDLVEIRVMDLCYFEYCKIKNFEPRRTFGFF